MRNKVTRAAALAAGGAGPAAALLALASGAATRALAGIEDIGDTASIAINHATVTGLARAGIVLLPRAPGGASAGRNGEIVALPVTGGDGNYVDTDVSAGGALPGSSNAGPPATQTFTASGLFVTKAGARYLNDGLHTTYFKAGQQIGTFRTTYQTQSTS